MKRITFCNAIQFAGFFSSIALMPVALSEVDENLEYNIDAFHKAESQFRKVQFSGKVFQENIKKVVLKFEADGVFD